MWDQRGTKGGPKGSLCGVGEVDGGLVALIRAIRAIRAIVRAIVAHYKVNGEVDGGRVRPCRPSVNRSYGL